MAEINKPDFEFAWANDGAVIKPDDSKISLGWTVEIPPHQWENYIQNRSDRAIQYLYQKGIPEWDNKTEYWGGRSYVVGNDGNLYRALSNSVGSNPVSTVGVDWEDILNTIVPVGTVSAFAGETAPSGYLFCRGQAVLRAEYPRLFSVIGTRYGSGDGNNTFNLPDYRAEFLRGLDAGRDIDSGRTLGSNQSDSIRSHTHTASITAAGAHTHTGSIGSGGVHSHTGSTDTQGAHSHETTISSGGSHNHTGSIGSAGAHTHTGTTSSSGAHTHTGTANSAGNHSHTYSGNTSSSGNHNHTGSTSISGGHRHTRGTMNITGSGLWGARFDNIFSGAFYRSPDREYLGSQSSDYDNYMGIMDASRTWTGHTSANGDHSHSITLVSSGAHTHSYSGNTSSLGAHTHSLSVNSSGAHTHSVTTNSAGAHTHTLTINNSGDHTHTANVASNGNHSHSLSINNSGEHTHSLSVDGVGNHTHNVSIGSTGSGETVPRNVSVNYIIKY